jgi:hypothetical protein
MTQPLPEPRSSRPSPMFVRMPWRPGPCAGMTGTLCVSATKFAYRHFGPLPANAWHALRFWYRWRDVPGAVGLSMGADWLDKCTYSVSAWRSAEDLRRWLGSAGHARVSREFRPHLRYSIVESWTADPFRLGEAWREAARRFAEAEATRGLKAPA